MPFDSFILTDGSLYIFQITIASPREIERGIVSFFSQRTILLGTGSRFVFVMAPGETIVCPESGNAEFAGLGGRVTLFSAMSDS